MADDTRKNVRLLLDALPLTGNGKVDLLKQVEEIFSPTGVLSRSPNFEYRPQQQEMAIAVAKSLLEGGHLIVEAGTGVGKSANCRDKWPRAVGLGTECPLPCANRGHTNECLPCPPS